MPMLPWPACPLAGQATLGHHTACGFMGPPVVWLHRMLHESAHLLRIGAQTTIEHSLTARRELIQNEIKSLIERLVPLIATVSSRKMRTKILIEWWCGHVGWKWCHVQCPFFWACSQALPATPHAAARKFKPSGSV